MSGFCARLQDDGETRLRAFAGTSMVRSEYDRLRQKPQPQDGLGDGASCSSSLIELPQPVSP
jgi:hypothetical protein